MNMSKQLNKGWYQNLINNQVAMWTINKFIIKSIVQVHKTEGPKEGNTNIVGNI